MSLWRQIRHGVKVLTNRAAADRQVDEEAEHFVEELSASLKAKGLPAAEAQRVARMGRPAAHWPCGKRRGMRAGSIGRRG